MYSATHHCKLLRYLSVQFLTAVDTLEYELFLYNFMNSHSPKSGPSTLFTSHFADYPVNTLLLKTQKATGKQEWITIKRNRSAK